MSARTIRVHDLIAAHGMPESFELAIWQEHAHLNLSLSEAQSTIQAYHEELKMAIWSERQPLRFE